MSKARIEKFKEKISFNNTDIWKEMNKMDKINSRFNVIDMIIVL